MATVTLSLQFLHLLLLFGAAEKLFEYSLRVQSYKIYLTYALVRKMGVLYWFAVPFFIVNHPPKNCKLVVNQRHHGLFLLCAERVENKRGKCLLFKRLPLILLIISI